MKKAKKYGKFDNNRPGEIDMTPEEKERKKIENLCEMFPQVECDLV
jgi:hypothetical protein